MSIIDTITSLFAPNNCLGCGREGRLLCATCINRLPKLSGSCFGCHQRIPAGAGCEACCQQAEVDSLHAIAGYNDVAKVLIAQLKFHSNQSAAQVIATCMSRAVTIPPTALLTHIPATTQHIRQRGYDQAELVVRHLARLQGVPRTSMLRRSGQKHQLGSNRQGRLVQLESALSVRHASRIEGSHIIVVDDVLTTGASLTAAAGVLRAAGAARIEGLVFAQA